MQRQRTVVVSIGLVTAALVATDLLISDVAEVWIEHPMAASMLSGAALLALTISVVDEVLRRRELQRWSSIARLAAREFGLRTAESARVVEDARLGVAACQRRGRPREEMAKIAASEVAAVRRTLDLTIARWSSICVQRDELIRALGIVVDCRNKAESTVVALARRDADYDALLARYERTLTRAREAIYREVDDLYGMQADPDTRGPALPTAAE